MPRTPTVLAFLALLQSVAMAGGNLTVTTTPAGDLMVVGDAEDNLICFTIEPEPLELIHVGGTINGGSSRYPMASREGRLFLHLGAGNDRFVVAQTHVARVIELRMGAGDDVCSMESGGDSLRLDLGIGDDVVDLEASAFDHTSIRCGSGSDEVSLYWYGADMLTVNAGGGDDRVSVGLGFLSGRCTFRGGRGTDELELDDPGFVQRPRITGFESIAE